MKTKITIGIVALLMGISTYSFAQTPANEKPVVDGTNKPGHIKTMTKEELNGLKELDAKMLGIDPNLQVVSYTMIRSGRRDPVDVTAKGSSITNEMKKIFKTIYTGDKIYFENVKVQGPGGKIEDVAALAYKIE